jgi:hypothetical protein
VLRSREYQQRRDSQQQQVDCCDPSIRDFSEQLLLLEQVLLLERGGQSNDEDVLLGHRSSVQFTKSPFVPDKWNLWQVGPCDCNQSSAGENIRFASLLKT